MTPFFSIIIPLYNKENFITDTLISALKQDFKDFEIIIVNDGSTDQSLEKVKVIKDSRIKIFTIENSGVSAARNFGIRKASSNYIAFLDADDLWEKNHLSNLYNLLNTFPNCGLYATAYSKKLENKTLKIKYHNIPDNPEWMGIVPNYFEASRYNAIAWTSAVMLPKRILESFNGFDESITLGAGEDTDLWIRVALKHPVAFYNSVTAIHNLHADNRLSNTNTTKRAYLNLDKYEIDSKTNASLKKYLDINRFSIGLQFMIAGNTEKAHSHFSSLKKENLNTKQRFLMKLNRPLLVVFVNLQKGLRHLNIHLTPFH
ncbi:MAG: glycosyltransferase family A protein [Xanthomarina sp.]